MNTEAVTRWFSLRRHLLVLLLGGVAVGWLIALTYSYRDAHREIDDLFDAQLALFAETLIVLAGDEDDEHELAKLESGGVHYRTQYVFQVLDDDGRLLLRSPHAPKTLLTTEDGFSSNGSMSGDDWRYYAQRSEDGEVRVVVAENHRARDTLAARIVWRLVIPALLGFPLLGAWIWYATYRGLAPLREIANDVAQREPERLTPVIPLRAAREVRPLLEALNALLRRVGDALARERRFTADAAHELRTPLAALVTQAEVASRARDSAEQEHALLQIAAGARRAGRLVEQLLTMTRLEPQAQLSTEPVRIDLLAAEVCADHAPLALEKHIVLELECSGEPWIAGVPDLLRILLRNLLDNALRYTPEHGRVAVELVTTSQGIDLRVTDSGPGILPHDRPLAVQRFHRLADQCTEGSGLGLSIVARIAELHQTELVLTDGPGGLGLRASVIFRSPPN